MFPYFILFSIFAVGAIQFPTDLTRRVTGGPLFLLAVVIATLMVGLRYEVGGDWFNYENIYKAIGTTSTIQGAFSQDPGYGIVNWLLYRTGVQIWAVNVVCAAGFMWGVVRFARRQPNPWLTMVVAVPYLIIVVAMGYTRQAVAIGFVFAIIADLEGGSLIRLGIYAVLAAAFHKSSVVVLPLIALTATRGRVWTSVVILLAVPLLYYAFLQASVDVLMNNYVGAEYNSSGASIRVAMNILPALIFLFFRQRFGATQAGVKLWRNFSYAALLALVMLIYSPSSTAVDRLALYIIPLQLFVLGRLPWAFPSRGETNKLALLAIIVYSAAIELTWLNLAANSEYWLPYQLFPL